MPALRLHPFKAADDVFLGEDVFEIRAKAVGQRLFMHDARPVERVVLGVGKALTDALGQVNALRSIMVMNSL